MPKWFLLLCAVVFFSSFASAKTADAPLSCPQNILSTTEKIKLALIKAGLATRYRFEIDNAALDDVESRGNKSILFLPNHPAYTDPPSVLTSLFRRFRPRPMMAEKETKRFPTGNIARAVNPISVPDVREIGAGSEAAIAEVVDLVVAALEQGDNIVLYPSGMLKRSSREDLRATSMVSRILERRPDQRVVLVRTTGLWGSSFGAGKTGEFPNVFKSFFRGAAAVMANLIAFTPKRDVKIDFFEPKEFPRQMDPDDGETSLDDRRRALKTKQNRFMEAYYNAVADPNKYVPLLAWWGKRKELPDPVVKGLAGELEETTGTQKVRDAIYAKIAADLKIDRSKITDDANLQGVLGYESVDVANLNIWLLENFNADVQVESLIQVRDLVIAATGGNLAVVEKKFKPVPKKWFKGANPENSNFLKLPESQNVAKAFLETAKRIPDQICMVDEILGPQTYLQVIQKILVFLPHIKEYPGKRLGIMMPASVGANIAYLAALFAGKTPVMINFTVGESDVTQITERLKLESILTSKAVTTKLKRKGDGFASVKDRFRYFEDLRPLITKWNKAEAGLKSYGLWGDGWAELENAQISDVAVMIATSGTSGIPKPIAYSHEMILAALHGTLKILKVRANDRFLMFLPPFHSFGYVAGMIMPWLIGTPTVYSPDPSAASTLGKLIERYRITLTISTPQFLFNMARAAKPEQLTSLRVAYVGAAALTRPVEEAVAAKAPHTKVRPGYGLTETTAVFSLVPEEEEGEQDSLGLPLDDIELVLVDPDPFFEDPDSLPDPSLLSEVAPGKPGVLLVRGPSIMMEGYAEYEGEQPYLNFNADIRVGGEIKPGPVKKWFVTGDIVRQKANKYLEFIDRLSRSFKRAGEMISPEKIEKALGEHYPAADNDSPMFFVQSNGDKHDTRAQLYTTVKGLEIAELNAVIAAAKLRMHNVDEIIEMDEIPLLATGKVNQRRMKEIRKERSGK